MRHVFIRSVLALVTAFAAVTVPSLELHGQNLFVDQRPSDLQWFVRSENGAPIRNSRCGDDVLFAAGNGGVWDVTAMRSTIATNLVSANFVARIEVYNGDANGPFGSPLHSFVAAVAPAGQNVTFEGRVLAIYDLSISDPDLFSVPAGQRRWIVPVVDATYGINERAYACSYNFNGTASGSVASYYNVQAGVPGFVPATGLNASMRDISFRLEATQRPTNDECAGALPLPSDSVAFDTRFASTGFIFGDNPCSGSLQFSNDIWFGFTSPCAANVTLSTCHPQTTFNTMLAVYGVCTTGSNFGLIACNDDDLSSQCLPNRARLTFAAQANTTYIIRLGGRATSGTGLLTVSGASPANDTCASLPAPVGPGLHPFCTRFANDSPVDAACDIFRKDIFVPFTTPTAGLHRLTTCDSSIVDTTLGLYLNCSTPAIACNNDSAFCLQGPVPRRSSICFRAGAGANYIARIGSGIFSQSGGAGSLRIAEPGDHNADGVFSVQDVFDFLEDWNSSGACSDFNGLDGTTVQDIYDFLAVWNARIG